MITNFKNEKIVACLDMGSSKVVCMIAAIKGEAIEIIGHGVKESKGIVGSAITDMRQAQKSIINAVSQAEKMAGINIDEVLVGISAIQTISNHREVRTKISSDSVRRCDVISLTEKIRAEYKKRNREIIHLIPMQYSIDGSYPVDNPMHMVGNIITSKFHVISIPKLIIQNIENCLKKCQISVSSYIVDCYASSLSCLDEDEKSLRTLLIDIGSHFTSFCLYNDEKIIYTNAVKYGGFNVTKDISMILNIDVNEAEKVKNLNSSLIVSNIERRELIRMVHGSLNGEVINITREEFRDIMQARLEEIFLGVKDVLLKSSIKIDMINNIVITGGATTTIGIDKVVADIFYKNVRVGYPKNIKTKFPDVFNNANSCSLGMIEFLRQIYVKESNKRLTDTQSNWLKRVLEKILS